MGRRCQRARSTGFIRSSRLEFNVQNVNAGRSGRKKTGRSPENIVAVKNSLKGDLLKNPDEFKSSARRNILVGISSATFNRITRIDFKLKPYK